MPLCPRTVALLLAAAATATGCPWRWERFGPAADGGADDDADEPSEADLPDCAAEGAPPCGAGALCLGATFAGRGGRWCCPGERCLEPGERTYVEAVRAAGAVTVDADATSDWAGVPPFEARRPALASRPEGSALSDLSAVVALQWDERGLYVLITITDDVIMPPDPCRGVVEFDEEACGPSPSFAPWRDDAVELFLDMDPLDTVPGTSGDGTYGDDGAHFFVNQLGEISQGSRSLDGWVADAAAEVRSPGWVVEASIAWPGPSPGAGDVIGFDLSVDDNDENEQPAGEMNTREDVLAWCVDRFASGGILSNDLTLAGLVRLVEGPPAEVSCPTEATFPCAGSCVPCGYPGCSDPRCE